MKHVLQLDCDFLLKFPAFELIKVLEYNRLITIINVLTFPHLHQLSLLGWRLLSYSLLLYWLLL
jgi:hypothetical protein